MLVFLFFKILDAGKVRGWIGVQIIVMGNRKKYTVCSRAGGF